MDCAKLQVKLNEKDVYAFQKRVLYQSVSKPVIYLLSFVFLLLSAFSLYTEISRGEIPKAFVLWLIFPIIFLIVFPLVLKRTSRSMMTTNKLIQNTQDYEFTNEGIGMNSTVGTAFLKWSDFYKAIESDESFLFFISKQQAYVIPKRCIENEEEMDFIRGLLVNIAKPKEKSKLLRFLVYYLIIIAGVIIFVTLYNR